MSLTCDEDTPPKKLPKELPAGTPFYCVYQHPWHGWSRGLTRSYDRLTLRNGVYRGGTGSAEQAVDPKNIAWRVIEDPGLVRELVGEARKA